MIIELVCLVALYFKVMVDHILQTYLFAKMVWYRRLSIKFTGGNRATKRCVMYWFSIKNVTNLFLFLFFLFIYFFFVHMSNICGLNTLKITRTLYCF